MEITYFGHSTFLIKTDKFKVLIDPFFESEYFDELNNLTHIFVTHGHSDHLGQALDLSLKTGALLVANAEIIRYLKRNGAINTHSMYIGGEWNFGFSVKMVTATHGSGIYEGNLVYYGGNPCGYLFDFHGIKLYHAGDTGLTMDMSLLNDESIDYCLLPIGGNYTMGIDDALKAVNLIRPKCVIPMHYKKLPIIDLNPKDFTSRLYVDSIILDTGEMVDLEVRRNVMKDIMGDLSTTELSDGQNGENVMSADIKPIDKNMSMFGPAFTIELPVGNSQSTIDALELAKPGDVLVIDAKGDNYRAVWGDVKSIIAYKKGIAGVVVDGAIRDVMGNIEIGLPIFCKSAVPRAALKGIPGKIGIDVMCGDVLVSPGDYIIGDANGVVVIRHGELDEVINKARAKYALDQEKINAVLKV